MRHYANTKPDENTPLDPPAKTSRARFASFLRRFKEKKSGGSDKKDDEKNSADPTEKRQQKQKQRGYLKLYIARLWPHWRMVVFLTILAIVVAALELCQPLFARYIIDQVLLGDLSGTEKFWRLNQVGAMFLAVIVVTRLASVARAWNQRLLNVRVVLTLRRALFERLVKLPLEQLSEMKVGGVISRLTDDMPVADGNYLARRRGFKVTVGDGDSVLAQLETGADGTRYLAADYSAQHDRRASHPPNLSDDTPSRFKS